MKVGLDDYLAAGHGLGDLLALASSELRPGPAVDEPAKSPYRETPGGFVMDHQTANGTVTVSLTNYTARITGDAVEDDGLETHRQFEVEGRLGGRVRAGRVTVAAFHAMSWPSELLGAGAITNAGFGLRDHARAAIQALSGDVPERTLYAHLGWREIDGHWMYLHAAGAVGPVGTVCRVVETHLIDGLTRYLLPDPPRGEALHQAVRASLRIIDVAPDPVSVAILAAAYRATLGEVDFGIHLSGPTGAGKTELEALAQQHFGPAMDARHLPASWSSTGNALEGLAFTAKDAVLAVDDYAPNGSTADVARLQGTAERLFRAQGNGSGRARMRADTSLRPTRAPRGLILSTGEDVPPGQSLRARVLLLELGPADLDWAALGRCQADAADGLYAAAMAGFVQWLAPQLPACRERTRADELLLRQDAHLVGSHRRTPAIIASLGAGLRRLLDFAQEVGAVSALEATALWQRCWAALIEAAAVQMDLHAGTDPVVAFRGLLAAAIASGKAHVAGQDGGMPSMPGRWGWRQEPVGAGVFEQPRWRPQGARVGWVVEADPDAGMYLDPMASFAAAQALGRETGAPIAVQAATLHRRVQQAGVLASFDGHRQRLTVRRTLDGARRSVLHLPLSYLQEPAQPAHEAHAGTPDHVAAPAAIDVRPEEAAVRQDIADRGVSLDPAVMIAIPTIACADYKAHQSAHRRLGKGWTCDLCSPGVQA